MYTETLISSRGCLIDEIFSNDNLRINSCIYVYLIRAQCKISISWKIFYWGKKYPHTKIIQFNYLFFNRFIFNRFINVCILLEQIKNQTH